VSEVEEILHESDANLALAKDKVLQLELAVGRIKALVDEFIPELKERKRLENRKYIQQLAICVVTAIVISVSITGTMVIRHNINEDLVREQMQIEHRQLRDRVDHLTAEPQFTLPL
jgi:multisubunit Na+/H+ antiporter MnhC subunit